MYLWGELQDLRLDPTQKIGPEPRMEGFDKFLREFFVLLLEGLQVSPLVGIQEIQEVEQLPNIVIQRRLKTSQ